MKTIITMAISISCMSGCVPVLVSVCSGGKCATGYYSESGDVLTAAHPFEDGERARIRSPLGFEDFGDVNIRENDTAIIRMDNPYHGKYCTISPNKGDIVTAQTLRGPVVTRVKSIHPNGLIINAPLSPGDSGAPVTRHSCVAGFVHGLAKNGGTVVLYRSYK